MKHEVLFSTKYISAVHIKILPLHTPPQSLLSLTSVLHIPFHPTLLSPPTLPCAHRRRLSPGFWWRPRRSMRGGDSLCGYSPLKTPGTSTGGLITCMCAHRHTLYVRTLNTHTYMHVHTHLFIMIMSHTAMYISIIQMKHAPHICALC